MSVSVSKDFHPAHVLAWLATEILHAVEATRGAEARERLASSPLDFWRSSWEDAGRHGHPLWKVVRSLPQEDQERFSAGFQLDAVKPRSA